MDQIGRNKIVFDEFLSYSFILKWIIQISINKEKLLPIKVSTKKPNYKLGFLKKILC